MPRRADEPRPEVQKAAAEAAELQRLAALARHQRDTVRWALAFPFLVVALFALVYLAPENHAPRPVLAVVGLASLILSLLLFVSTLFVVSLIFGKVYRSTRAGLDLVLGKLFRQLPPRHVLWGFGFPLSGLGLVALAYLTPANVVERPVLNLVIVLAALILVLAFLASTVVVVPRLVGKLFRSTAAVLDLVLGKVLRQPPPEHARWGVALVFSAVALFALIYRTRADVSVERPAMSPPVALATLILVVLFIASSVAVATPLARKVFVSTGAVLSLVVGKLLRRPPGKHPATPARTADPVSSPRLIQLKRWRRWSWILLWCSAILVLGDPAFGGVLATALMIVLSLTVTIRRESRPLRTPVLNDIARPSPDSGRLKHKRRRWRISVAATIVGFVAVATCRAAFFPRESSAFWDATDSLMWITFLTAFGVSVAGSVKHGRIVERDERKRRSKVLEWQDVADAEFVLYLRSFADDVATSRFMAGGLTAEEHFARILNQVGPLVAVGSPGEEQPELGAYRLYLDQSEWQESVAILMGRAKLVVIRTGLSDGLSWEIERAVGLVEPQRLLIVVDDADEMRRCLSWMRTVHPQVSSNVKLGYRRACGIRGLLVFDENWRVTALRMRGMGWYRHRSGNIVDPGLARSMYPVFQTLGVEWPPPRIAVVRSLLLALALWVVIGLVFDLMASLQS